MPSLACRDAHVLTTRASVSDRGRRPIRSGVASRPRLRIGDTGAHHAEAVVLESFIGSAARRDGCRPVPISRADSALAEGRVSRGARIEPS